MSTADKIALAVAAIAALALIANFFAQMAVVQRQGENQRRQAIFQSEFAANLAKFQADLQKQLETMKEEYARAREQRQFVLPERLESLNHVRESIQSAYRVGTKLDSATVAPSADQNESDMKKKLLLLEESTALAESVYMAVFDTLKQTHPGGF